MWLADGRVEALALALQFSFSAQTVTDFMLARAMTMTSVLLLPFPLISQTRARAMCRRYRGRCCTPETRDTRYTHKSQKPLVRVRGTPHPLGVGGHWHIMDHGPPLSALSLFLVPQSQCTFSSPPLLLPLPNWLWNSGILWHVVTLCASGMGADLDTWGDSACVLCRVGLSLLKIQCLALALCAPRRIVCK